MKEETKHKAYEAGEKKKSCWKNEERRGGEVSMNEAETSSPD